MTTQPAGEHHTGSLELTGEGNAPASPISDALVEAASRANWDHRTRGTGCGILWDDYEPTRSHALDPFRDGIRATLEAAYPAIRQQVAEEITAALAARRGEITEGRPGWVYLSEAIDITNRVGGVA